MAWHGYTLQNGLPPGFTIPEKMQAWDALLRIGLHEEPQPCRNTHGRQQLDFNGFINEAVFEPHELERDFVVHMIADEILVDWHAIDALLLYIVFVPGGTWNESRLACITYMKEHYDEWEPPEL